MAWTTPKNFTSVVLPASDMNTYVSDNTQYLKDKADVASQMQARFANASFSNTTVEQTLASFSVLGGTLGTDKILHFSMVGTSANNNSPSLQFVVRCKYGATTFAQFVMTNVNNGNFTNPMAMEVELFAAGATNQQRGKSILWFNGIANGDANGGNLSIDFGGGGGGGLTLGNQNGVTLCLVHNGIAEDSTAAKTFSITMQASIAHSSIAFSLLRGYLELK
jgi:hypothetical protein